jgi:hypothetical protein
MTDSNESYLPGRSLISPPESDDPARLSSAPIRSTELRMVTEKFIHFTSHECAAGSSSTTAAARERLSFHYLPMAHNESGPGPESYESSSSVDRSCIDEYGADDTSMESSTSIMSCPRWMCLRSGLAHLGVNGGEELLRSIGLMPAIDGAYYVCTVKRQKTALFTSFRMYLEEVTDVFSRRDGTGNPHSRYHGLGYSCCHQHSPLSITTTTQISDDLKNCNQVSSISNHKDSCRDKCTESTRGRVLLFSAWRVRSSNGQVFFGLEDARDWREQNSVGRVTRMDPAQGSSTGDSLCVGRYCCTGESDRCKYRAFA